MLDLEITITEHAARRMNQRSITTEMVELALEIGRRIYARDTMYVFVGKRCLTDMHAEAERLEGLTLVLSPKTHELITCFRNRQWTKKIRHKKYKRRARSHSF